ncbi:MAG TPA: hypothetical protein PLU43_08205, partial [Lachnospiraceae bacterium]|nr:hypothetical protein [Lachnospiraceae bacterium]
TLSYPIYISATASGGVLNISFYSNSTATNGIAYEISVEGTDQKNATYIVGYLNGIEVSRVKAYTSSYK